MPNKTIEIKTSENGGIVRLWKAEVSMDAQDFDKIEKLVRDANPLVMPAWGQDIYDLKKYIYAARANLADIHVVIDNNIFTVLEALASGEEVDNNNENNMAACAVMSFLGIGGLNVEPSGAIFEKDHPGARRNSSTLKANYLIADEVSYVAYANIALGRQNQLTKAEFDEAKACADSRSWGSVFDKDQFSVQYNICALSCLKALSILRGGGCGVAALKEYYEWVANTGVLSGPGMQYAKMAFSTKETSLNKKRNEMFKDKRSKNPELAIKGAYNAACDLAYLHMWKSKCEHAQEYQPNVFWAFCTLDIALYEVANAMYGTASSSASAANEDEGKIAEDARAKFSRKFWEEEQVIEIEVAYRKLTKTEGLMDKAKMLARDVIKTQKMIDDLKDEVRAIKMKV